MGTSWLAGLSYPALSDNPNGPQAFQELAEDVERELYRPFPCTSTTRPSDPRVRTGMLIYETDTGKVYLWNDDDWVFCFDTALTGGGGTPDGGVGRWHHNTTQAVTTTLAVLALNTEDLATTAVTRQTQGSGHKFVLNEDGIYSISGYLYYPTGTSGGRYLAINPSSSTALVDAYDVMWVTSASDCIVKVSMTDRFTAGAELTLVGLVSGASSINAFLQKFRIAKVAA